MSILERFFAFFAPIPQVQFSRWEEDPVEAVVGIHVISHMGSFHEFLGAELSPHAVRTALSGLDWESEFHQVVVVLEPGISMDVGGSLSPAHGLSATYSNRINGVETVIGEPPADVAEMESILLGFLEWEAASAGPYKFDSDLRDG